VSVSGLLVSVSGLLVSVRGLLVSVRGLLVSDLRPPTDTNKSLTGPH